MIEFNIVTDMLGRSINVPLNPKRIISLVPSKTELLYDLGLRDEIVGQTLFCIHPKQMYLIKPRIGGTKKLNFKSIDNLNPDLIIANKEENNKADVERLAEKYPVWISDIKNLTAATDMIMKVGDLVNKSAMAVKVCTEIELAFKTIYQVNNTLKVLYLIWQNPFMAAGTDTFINSMLTYTGMQNIIKNSRVNRYPQVDEDTIKKADVILLSSEPFPFKEKHIQLIKEINKNALVLLANGELFSWYGSRLKFTPHYLNGLVQQVNNYFSFKPLPGISGI